MQSNNFFTNIFIIHSFNLLLYVCKTMKLLLLFMFFAFVSCVFSERFNENRILNGTQTSNDMFQNVVKIISFPYIENGTDSYVADGSICTATIISNRHLLTAAHCVWEYAIIEKKEVRVKHISQFLDLRPTEPKHDEFFNISNYALIPEANASQWWDGLTFHGYDIAILTFAKGFNFGIQPVILANDYEPSEHDTGIIAGYGNYQYDPTTNMSIFEPAPTLRDTSVNIMQSCPFIELVQEDVICAGSSLQRPDHGDSGGPLFINGNETMYQVGLTSHGGKFDGTFNDSRTDFVIFTRVPRFCEWIQEVTEEEVRCYSMNEDPPIWSPPSTEAPPTTETPSSTTEILMTTSETPEPNPETSMPTTNSPETEQTNEPSIIVTTAESEKSGKEKYAHLPTMLPYDDESPPSSTPMITTMVASASFLLCLVLYTIF